MKLGGGGGDKVADVAAFVVDACPSRAPREGRDVKTKIIFGFWGMKFKLQLLYL